MSLQWGAHRTRVRLIVLAAFVAVAAVVAVTAQAASARPATRTPSAGLAAKSP